MTSDIIGILESQHVQIRTLLAEVRTQRGARRREAFDTVRELLAGHETAEEMLLRPFSAEDAGTEVAGARNAEEHEANRVLARLERLDPDSAEFDALFPGFEASVLAHAEAEERDEFPAVRRERDPQELERLGRAVLAVQRVGPTHPHPVLAGSPAAQWTVGPFVALLDRARDALGAALR